MEFLSWLSCCEPKLLKEFCLCEQNGVVLYTSIYLARSSLSTNDWDLGSSSAGVKLLYQMSAGPASFKWKVTTFLESMSSPFKL